MRKSANGDPVCAFRRDPQSGLSGQMQEVGIDDLSQPIRVGALQVQRPHGVAQRRPVPALQLVQLAVCMFVLLIGWPRIGGSGVWCSVLCVEMFGTGADLVYASGPEDESAEQEGGDSVKPGVVAKDVEEEMHRLQRGNAQERFLATVALGQSREQGAPAIPLLEGAMDDEHSRVRWGAGLALGVLARDKVGDAVGALQRGLVNPSSEGCSRPGQRSNRAGWLFCIAPPPRHSGGCPGKHSPGCCRHWKRLNRAGWLF